MSLKSCATDGFSTILKNVRVRRLPRSQWNVNRELQGSVQFFFQGQRVRGTKPRDRECKTYHRRTPNLTSFIPGIRLRE